MLAGPIILFIALAAILIPKLPGYMGDGGGGGHSQFYFNNDAFLYETASNFQISQSKSVKQVGFNSIGNPGYRLFYRP